MMINHNKKCLNFRIGDMPILTIILNLENQTSTIVWQGDELSLHPILLPNERNYQGIESRFQEWFQTDEKLPAILQDIQQYGFQYAGQINLHLDIQ